MFGKDIIKTLATVADFYDQRKVGDIGALGFRRSTDLKRLLKCITRMKNQNLFKDNVKFLDMGCADGRVNVLLSYLCEKSIGIELDDWTLDEYAPLKTDLESNLKINSLPLPPDNIFLYTGDSMDDNVYNTIKGETGVSFEKFDIFYTYLTMQEEFAELIAEKAKQGALFMVYGLEKIIPRFEGLRLLSTEKPLEGIVSVYEKTKA